MFLNTVGSPAPGVYVRIINNVLFSVGPVWAALEGVPARWFTFRTFSFSESEKFSHVTLSDISLL